MNTAFGPGWKRPVVFLFLFAVAFLAIYSPVYTHTYLFSDDYSALYSFVAQDGNVRALIDAGGRQTAGMIVESGFRLAGQVANLGWLRFISILGLAGLSWMMFAELRKRGHGTAPSLLLGGAIGVMPASVMYAFWTCLFSVPYAAIMGCLAAKTAGKLMEAEGRAQKAGLFAAAVTLQTLAFTWYQPCAVYFWAFAAIALLGGYRDNRTLLRHFGFAMAVFVTSAVISYGFVRYGLMTHPGVLGTGRGTLVQSLPDKLIWFVQTPLMMALNFVSTRPTAPFALVTGALILLGLGLHLKRRGTLMAGLPVALMVLGLTYLPNLAVSENWATFRTEVALTSFVLLCLFFALQGYAGLFGNGARPVVVVALGLFVAIMGYRAVDLLNNHLVGPQVKEYANLKNTLARYDFDQHRQVVVLLSPFPEEVFTDEVHLPSFSVDFVPESAIKLVVRELKQDPSHLRVRVQRADDRPRMDGDLVLDAKTFFDYGKQP